MGLSKTIIVFSIIFLLSTVAISMDSQSAEERLQQLFSASELLRMDDPKIRIKGVLMLFDLKGLYAYTTLKYMWLAESDPKVRNAILKGFRKVGDHLYIADPDFPKDWVVGIRKFDQTEKNRRLRELKKYFPTEVDRYLETGS